MTVISIKCTLCDHIIWSVGNRATCECDNCSIERTKDKIIIQGEFPAIIGEYDTEFGVFTPKIGVDE